MTSKTISTEELALDVTDAQEAAGQGPVIITVNGTPSHVLLSMDDYMQLLARQRNLVELLAMPGISDIELDISRPYSLPRPAEFD